MKLFGPRDPREGLLTFGAPSDALTAARAREQALVLQLRDAADAADLAQHELQRAKETYRRTPTGTNLDALRQASLRALEKEAAFDALWQRASRQWFGHPAAAVH